MPPDALSGVFSGIDFSSQRAVVVAVSGGGDSIALLLLLKAYLDRAMPSVGLVAATVDHGLRPESAAEAAIVRDLARRIGVDWEGIRWEGEKPEAGIPAAAREARYRLLRKIAERAGAGTILTGHTADDQHETVAMRRRRAEGRGLAGMASATLYDGAIWIVRPLLGIRRSALRDFLRQKGASWIDDPTNVDPAYERARVRTSLAEASDAEVARSLAAATKAAEERMSLGVRAAELIRFYATQPSPGLLKLDRALAAAEDRPAAVYVLRILLAVAGGSEQLPHEARVATLFERLSSEPFRFSIAGAVLDSRGSGIFLLREMRGDGPPGIAAVDGKIFDGRFRVRVSDKDRASRVHVQGKEAARNDSAGDAAPASLARAAFALEPIRLWDAKMDEGGPRIPLPLLMERVAAPWACFLPRFDLAPARAVAELIGAPPVPPPPFVGHIGPYA